MDNVFVSISSSSMSNVLSLVILLTFKRPKNVLSLVILLTFKRPKHQPRSSNSGMGEPDDSAKNDAAAKVKKDEHEKKEKHADEDGKGEKGEEKARDKKKKDKSGKEGKDDGGKEKKKKNQEDKKDPAQLKLKLEKLDTKIQALAAKKEEILKLLNEVEANPAGGAVPPATLN